MSIQKTATNGKRLRREVQGLLSDAEEHLPDDFHSRLREVSQLFFEHRREVGRLQESLTAAERQLQRMTEALAEQEHKSANYEESLKAAEKQVDQLAKDLAAKQSESETLTDMCLQMQFTTQGRIDDLTRIIGDVALREQRLEVASIRRSDDVDARIESGELADEQVDKFVARAVGYFIAQIVPENCVYEWYPLDLAATVRTDKEDSESLQVLVTAIKNDRRDYLTISDVERFMRTLPPRR